MNGPRCEYCRHFNPRGARFCEACEAPLAAGPAAGEPSPAAGGPSAQPTAADAIPAPPFRRAGDVISPMLVVYRKHFTLVGILVLTTMVPEALVRYGVVDFKRGGLVFAGAGTGFTSAQGLLLWLLSMACGSLLSAALVFAVADLQRAGQSSAGECLSRGLQVWPRVFILMVLYTLIITVGFVFLLVPGVILSLMFTVCIPAAVIEGRGPVDALKRSCELTQGSKGLIFMTTFLWGLLIVALNWLVMWSFARGVKIDVLPSLLLQTGVLGMLTSSGHVLTVYVYLGLLRERQSGLGANASAQQGAAAAAG